MELFWSIVHKENQEVWRCVALIFVLLPWSTGKVLLMERFQKSHNTLKVDGGQQFWVKSGRPWDFPINYSFRSFRKPFWIVRFQLLTLIGKSWKTHPEIFLKFSFSGSSYRPFYWKTHLFEFFWLKPYMIWWHLVWRSFPLKRPVWRPRIIQLSIGWVFQ